MSSYPSAERQGKYFSHRFCRLLTKTATAQELGPEACWLLAVIVHQEDAIRYSRAITFWNDQLLPLCGFGSRKRLESARSKAVDAGWLHYEAGSKSKIGRYWVTIPEAFTDLNDFPIDEGGNFEGRNGTANGLRDETERKAPGQKHQGGTATAHHSTLPLNPNPKGKRFSYPKDFEAFWKVYPAGRKTKKKIAFKAWGKAIGEAEPQAIIEAAAEYAASHVGQGEFVQMPASWLNGECWSDDREAWKDKSETNKPKSQYENLG